MYQRERDKELRLRRAQQLGRDAVWHVSQGNAGQAKVAARDAASVYLAAINGDLFWR